MKKDDDDEFRKDFKDSVIYEELDMDTIPAELMAAFEASAFGHSPTVPAPLIDESDTWSLEPYIEKYDRHRKR
jgi:hypothetical protein